jgi:hypothetical protein
VPRPFQPTPVFLDSSDAEWIYRILEVLNSNPDNPAWGDPIMPSMASAKGLQTRLDNRQAAASASDTVRHRIAESDAPGGGAWELVDGEPVAFIDADGERYPVTDSGRPHPFTPSEAAPPPAPFQPARSWLDRILGKPGR